ncbi:uncharacterized protein PV09_02248 [Verruconis gallopava]|uniref:Scramblase-domain-containing protein n=1 Tax=Verruconis gallopava TaxID=253628 RepID=A0A0D2ALN2_9PEZI|nr:uncharacterized protein PV09_02248 [Verruconis gallopava]KIW07405.1 hypothetical protein PV09_02248 [Verruconis gallopava]
MFPASRWAARLSQKARLVPAYRYISTKESGIARKTPRFGLSHNLRNARQSNQEPHLQREQDSENPHGRSFNDARQVQGDNVAQALQRTAHSDQNDMLSPVHIPDDPLAILKPDHPAMGILANSTIIIQRQIEMMNIMIGFEQANKYVILDPLGNHIGYLAEPDGNMLKRQLFKTHRGFTVHVFDKYEKEVLRITRPFTFINSRVGVYDAVNPDPNLGHHPTDALQGISAGSIANRTSAQLSPLRTEEMRIIGEVQQQWAPLRRKYNLFLNRPAEVQDPNSAPQLTAGSLPLSTSTALQTVDSGHRTVHMSQWAYCDEPFLSWDFSLLSADSRLLGSVNRNFAGFAREIFTDTGVYALRMDSAALAAEPRHLISRTGERALRQHEQSAPGMTLDQRAVMLATAVSIDFDYFSRHSGSGGILPIPMWIPWWGGGAAEAGAAGGAAEAGAAAGAVGAAESAGALGTEVGAAARGAGALGAGESAVAGVGSIAGYEAMQRGFGRVPDDASPTVQDPYSPQNAESPAQQEGEESFWGERAPWEQDGQSPWRQYEENPWGSQNGQSPWGGANNGEGDGEGDWGDWF